MNWKKVLQLAMVHVGVSITVVPVTSTLNRIMIADMHLSALLVGLLISLPYLLSPLQVLVGDWADKRVVWGRHRSPWIVIGGLMASFGSYLTAHAVFLMEVNFLLGLLASFLVFTIWGMGVNIASVSYLSLVTELGQENTNWRSRTVSIMWTVMILSTIATSIALSQMLEPYSKNALYTAFGAVWMIASSLVLFGAANIEPAALPGRVVHNSANNPLVAFRLLLKNPVARRFFFYLLLVLISIHAQDVLLEPFGAEALQMPVAQTSRLTSIWGTGVFLTLTGGLWLVRRVGKKASANFGAVVTALAFMAIIFTGLAANVRLFMAAVFVLGLGGGLMTVSNLSFMLDMTIPQAAGLYIGAWGVANFAGQALGNIISGLMRDLFYQVTGNVLTGYVSVFGMEVVGLLIAIWIFRKISVDEFRRDAEVRIHEVLALAGD
jgi:BCD family chlorophyll transporter-like MFS transporter